MLTISENMIPEELLNVLQLAIFFNSDNSTISVISDVISKKLNKFEKHELLLLHLINAWKPLDDNSEMIHKETFQNIFDIVFDEKRNISQGKNQEPQSLKSILFKFKTLSIFDLFYLIFSHNIRKLNGQLPKDFFKQK
jgi:hypothetical protein